MREYRDRFDKSSVDVGVVASEKFAESNRGAVHLATDALTLEAVDIPFVT
jgi:hypothetical protein